MMAIEPLWIRPIDAAEFVELSCHKVFERTDKSRVKYNLGESVAPEIVDNPLLMFKKSCGTVRARKRRRKIKVEACFDSPLPG